MKKISAFTRTLAFVLVLCLCSAFFTTMPLVSFAEETETESVTTEVQRAATSSIAVYPAVDAYWNVIAVGDWTNFKTVAGTGTGTGYDFVDFNNALGSVDFTVNVEEAGEYYLAVGWSTANERSFNLVVNSETINTYSCTSNGGWYVAPLYHVAKVSLKAGDNLVQVQRQESAGAPSIQNLTVIPASEILTNADNPTLGGNAKVVESASGFDGSAFDTGNSLGTITWDVTVPVSGTYKAIVPYSTKRTSIALSLVADDVTTDLSGTVLSTTDYGTYWNFLTGLS